MTRKTRSGSARSTSVSFVMIQHFQNTDAPDAQLLFTPDESVSQRARFSLVAVAFCAPIISRKVETTHYTGRSTPTTALFVMVVGSWVSNFRNIQKFRLGIEKLFLVICDGCPAAYHQSCLEKKDDNMLDSLDNSWFCPNCSIGFPFRYGDIVWAKVNIAIATLPLSTIRRETFAGGRPKL